MDQDAPVVFHSPETLSKPMGYSHAVEVRRGRTVYISGQVSLDASGALVGEDDFHAQVTQVFVNLGHALTAAGATYADLVKLTYYCSASVPAERLPVVRDVRDQFVNTEAPPASSFVFVSRLVRPEWLIEIDAVAVVSDAGEQEPQFDEEMSR